MRLTVVSMGTELFSLSHQLNEVHVGFVIHCIIHQRVKIRIRGIWMCTAPLEKGRVSRTIALR